MFSLPEHVAKYPVRIARFRITSIFSGTGWPQRHSCHRQWHLPAQDFDGLGPERRKLCRSVPDRWQLLAEGAAPCSHGCSVGMNALISAMPSFCEGRGCGSARPVSDLPTQVLPAKILQGLCLSGAPSFGGDVTPRK